MSENYEGTEDRLANLKAIEPLITALRTKALSTLQSALNRKNLLHDYCYDYRKILTSLNINSTKQNVIKYKNESDVSGVPYLIVLGSERGICGSFDKSLAKRGSKWTIKQKGNYRILAYGRKGNSDLNQEDIKYESQGSLSSGSLPKYQIAHNLVKDWLKGFDQSRIESLEILSFRKSTKETYKPVLTRLIPILQDTSSQNYVDSDWPFPIIEGDPSQIVDRILEHLTAITFYEIILESIAAENLFRYNLLEEAKKNIDELVDSLTTITQIAKRAAITQQIQELSVGAGLTNN